MHKYTYICDSEIWRGLIEELKVSWVREKGRVMFLWKSKVLDKENISESQIGWEKRLFVKHQKGKGLFA